MSYFNKDTLLKRLEKNKIISDDGCWYLKGEKTSFKREMYICSRNYLVSRISAYIYHNLDLHNTRILVCHKCRGWNCWNPEHIYLGNTSTNTKDAIKDGTFKNPNTDKEFCKYGHPLSGMNLYEWRDRRTGQRHRWCRICRNDNSIKNRELN
jgi:hypothetical protein